MRDLIMTILVCLIIAAIIGFIIGWLMKHLFCKRQLAEIEGQWRTKYGAIEGDVGGLRGQLSDRDAAIKKLQASSGSSGDDGDADLRAELRKAEGRLVEMDSDLSQAQSDLDQAQADLKACQESKASDPSGTSTFAPVTPAAPAATSAATTAPTSSGDRPAWLMSSPSEGDPDDLKKIWGVGPVLEKTMNNLGIYYFRQVAKFTGQDILWVAENINAFPDRIERDKWVEQAHKLHTDKYGSEP